MASLKKGKGVAGDTRRPASQDIPGARLTVSGVLLVLFYLGVPVAILGNLLDLLFQWWFGWCIGLWCLVN
jgi:hypothetical protein